MSSTDTGAAVKRLLDPQGICNGEKSQAAFTERENAQLLRDWSSKMIKTKKRTVCC